MRGWKTEGITAEAISTAWRSRGWERGVEVEREIWRSQQAYICVFKGLRPVRDPRIPHGSWPGSAIILPGVQFHHPQYFKPSRRGLTR